jgi:2'-5' RNA ligase
VRLFVAVNLPEALREAIHAAAKPLRDAGLPVKWVGPEALHLTLKFLGEVKEGRVSVRSFTLGVGGFGGFPTGVLARVLWVGCEPAPPLELLQDGVERGYAALGFPVEGRPFRPHLTLGRARKEERHGVRGAGPILESLEFADTFLVQSVDL